MKKITSLLVSAIIAFGIASFTACSNGSGDGSNSSTGGVAFVNELSFASPAVAGKLFSCKNNNGSLGYFKFKDGRCYMSYSLDNSSSWKDMTSTFKYVAFCNGGMWLSEGKLTRKSGSGLFTTWNTRDGGFITVKSNGTIVGKMYGYDVSGFFSNHEGLLRGSLNGNGQTQAIVHFYDGIYIHATHTYPLVFIKNID